MTNSARSIFVRLVLIAVPLVVVSGCSNKASFTQDKTQTGSLGTTDLPGMNDPNTQAVAATCEEAARKGTMKSQSQPLHFPDPGQTCDWDKDGNLGKRDLWHQARIEQRLTVTLPTGSTLCHVAFDFPSQQFRFDDHFWFLFNDVIMASSLRYDDRFGVTNGLSLYNWSKLVGTNWDTSREGIWCLAGASCSWPKTDTDGRISMNFRTGTYYAVTARDRSRNVHEFSFVTVGDNDATDCQHKPVDVNATLQYVQ